MRDEVPNASYLTFGELFADEQRFFVPEYQRSYDWGEKQREDLFDDLERLDQLIVAGNDSNHFCGTIICTPPTQSGHAMAVVDGQQRLTTLALLHSRLSRAANRPGLIHADGSVRFSPQSVDANTFGRILRGEKPGVAETIAQQNYIRAAAEIDSWIKKNAKRTDAFLDHIENRLHFILFVLRDETEVAKVFETINTRGKPLSQIDLVKNHLMYISAVQGWTVPNVNEVWRRIQKIAGSSHFVDGDMDMILRAIVTAQFRPGRRKAGETDFSIVAQGLSSLDSKWERFDTFIRFIESSFQTFESMRKANTTDPKKPIERALTFLNHHAGISGVLPLILSRQFLWSEDADDEKKAEVLQAIEIANFRLYGLPGASARTDSYNVVLHSLAHDYFHKRKTDDDVVAELKATVIKSQKDGLSTIVRSLSLSDDDDYDFNTWPWLRYFLGRFEEHLLDSQSFDFSRLHLRQGLTSRSNDVLTIEHIWPRNAENKTVEESNDRQQIRRLGNLMLLPNKLNIQRSNGDLDFKSEKTSNSQAVILRQNEMTERAAGRAKIFAEYLARREDGAFGEVKKRFNKPTIEANWDIVRVRTLCDLREEAMISFALSAWRFREEAGSGHSFEGMFSLPHDGEAFLASKEHTGIKANDNYVIRSRDSSGARAAQLLMRIKARRKLIGDEFEPVVWS